MAALLNRSISALGGGDAPSQQQLQRPILAQGSNAPNSSPLQIFVKAKRKINDIFVDIDDYVRDAIKFIQSIPKDKDIISESDGKDVDGYVQKVAGIREVLARDHMKVAFFGRTSNGKSTVINAMLHDKILPSGIGHTTNCFLQVEGSESGEAYLVTEGSDEKQNVKSVGQLAHALCNEKLCESSLVRVFWPKQKCPLLRDDVVFVDSPGIDVSPNLDEWIDKHCLDADVFVLVANAESTLMVTEKNFFHKVSTRLSKPNIFILNNRWDASATEPDYLDQVRSQHVERDMDFLVKELKVCEKEEAQERIFFVSAKEALQGRMQEQKGMPVHTGAIAEGFPTRYFEFQDFERKFEECISKSAVRTKFEQHSQRGRHISQEVRAAMDRIYSTTQRLRGQKQEGRRELLDKLDFTEKQLELLTREMKEKICQMTGDVNQKVSKALSEEIRRLSVLVEEFSMPFHPDPLVLNVYKRELHCYVEGGLGSNLRARLSSTLAANIESSQREMAERMSSLLPSDKKQLSLNLLPRREPFEVLYRLNCDNLCSDFKEDIDFHFSLGVNVLFARLVRSGAAAFMAGGTGTSSSSQVPTGEVPPHVGTPAGTPLGPPFGGDSCLSAQGRQQQQSDFALIARVALATVTSQGTMGGLIIGGFLFKTVGWRVIVVTGGIYGCLYMYERLTWTNKAKERTFKRQYVDYVTRKLRMIVDLTSANCSHQVQQELSSTMARLSYLVDEATTEMQAEIGHLEKELKMLDETVAAAKVLRNKANFLIQELEIFDQAYIRGKEK